MFFEQKSEHAKIEEDQNTITCTREKHEDVIISKFQLYILQ